MTPDSVVGIERQFGMDDDDGVDEALRRSREMDEKPEISLTDEEFIASFDRYRK